MLTSMSITISMISVQFGNAFVMLRCVTCERTPFRFFKSKEIVSNNLILKNINNLLDYKPIEKQGTEDIFRFTLHHNISFTPT